MDGERGFDWKIENFQYTVNVILSTDFWAHSNRVDLYRSKLDKSYLLHNRVCKNTAIFLTTVFLCFFKKTAKLLQYPLTTCTEHANHYTNDGIFKFQGENDRYGH
jgi:hypothetical protein